MLRAFPYRFPCQGRGRTGPGAELPLVVARRNLFALFILIDIQDALPII